MNVLINIPGPDSIGAFLNPESKALMLTKLNMFSGPRNNKGLWVFVQTSTKRYITEGNFEQNLENK